MSIIDQKVAEQIRATSDKIWNAGAKLTHNDLDHILIELCNGLFNAGLEAAKESLPEEKIVRKKECTCRYREACDKCLTDREILEAKAFNSYRSQAITNIESKKI